MKSISVILASLVLSAAPAFAADTHGSTTHEFDGMCATGLVMGKEVKTDCKINWTDEKTHKTYCFSSEEMKKTFAADTSTHIKKAQENYSKTHAGTSHGSHS